MIGRRARALQRTDGIAARAWTGLGVAPRASLAAPSGLRRIGLQPALTHMMSFPGVWSLVTASLRGPAAISDTDASQVKVEDGICPISMVCKGILLPNVMHYQDTLTLS